jgi:hypothetical protein
MLENEMTLLRQVARTWNNLDTSFIETELTDCPVCCNETKYFVEYKCNQKHLICINCLQKHNSCYFCRIKGVIYEKLYINKKLKKINH